MCLCAILQSKNQFPMLQVLCFKIKKVDIRIDQVQKFLIIIKVTKTILYFFKKCLERVQHRKQRFFPPFVKKDLKMSLKSLRSVNCLLDNHRDQQKLIEPNPQSQTNQYNSNQRTSEDVFKSKNQLYVRLEFKLVETDSISLLILHELKFLMRP